MKTMLKTPLIYMLLLLFAGGLSMSSCSSDDDKADSLTIDKAALISTIDAANQLLEETVEGGNDGEYPAEAREALQAAIDAADAVSSSSSVTQDQVNNAVSSLEQAVNAYNTAVIAPIAEADLIGHWAFDEGSGTVASDNSANGFDGAFKTGPELWGAGTPEWTKDRHGEDGKALQFDKGANIEIPYNMALNPKSMSISLWIKADEVKPGNRFIGMHSWFGYKFELQEANKPFFTVNTDQGGYDKDAQKVELPLNEWHHIAVTFGGGNMIFYIDGAEVMRWEDTPGEAKSLADDPYNLVFGQDCPTNMYAETIDNIDIDQKIPLEWGGFFHGALDEIRMYKTVLSASQIQSVYDREKP